MQTLFIILVVLGVLAYLTVGFVIARAIQPVLADTLKWWQGGLIMLLWPLAIFLPLLAVVDWMRRGSH